MSFYNASGELELFAIFLGNLIEISLLRAYLLDNNKICCTENHHYSVVAFCAILYCDET
jgi:hypothetical protein